MTLRRVASVGIAVVGVAVAVWLVGRDEAATDALVGIAAITLVWVVLAQAVNVTTDSVRYWMVIPDRFRPSVPLWRWHHIFSVGRLLNMLVPQAGAAYRAARLKLGHGVPISTYMGSIAAITWLGNGIALLVAAVVVAFSGEPVAGGAIALAGAGILLAIRILPKLRWFTEAGAPGWMSPRVVSMVGNFGEAFRELGDGQDRLRRVLTVSVVSQLAGLAAYVFVVDALGATEPILVGSVIYTGTTIATVVSLSPGGLGITELTAGLFGAALEFGAGAAVLAAFIIRVTGIAAVGTLALLAGFIAPEPAPPTRDM